MSEVIEQFVPTRDMIDRLQREMIQYPQAELKTEHYFSQGMYCRKVVRPAGTLIVGKVHKKDHFFLCAAGEIIAWTENGMKHFMAGDVVESKHLIVCFVIGGAFFIYENRIQPLSTDLDEIEKELIEPDDLAMFDSRNKLKPLEDIERILRALK